MPFGDGGGPLGQGPRTGRGAGSCGGFGEADFSNRGGGRGFAGRGRGSGGRGQRNRFRGPGPAGFQRAFDRSGRRRGAFAVSIPGDEVPRLKNQAAYFESALENIRKRIESLESKSEQE